MDGSGTADRVDPLTVTKRLQAEGRWYRQIEPERNEMMKLAKKRLKTKVERQQWVYSELDRMYPPLPASQEIPEQTTENRTLSSHTCTVWGGASDRTLSGSQRPVVDAGQIQGLGDIPEAWPELPANSSLAVEVAWVQANRLRVIEERSGAATLIHLDRALSPAPSWAALGWLETSIRSYAKYVDVAAKATASDGGEAEVWRRERMAIEEVSSLLDEMRGDG